MNEIEMLGVYIYIKLEIMNLSLIYMKHTFTSFSEKMMLIPYINLRHSRLSVNDTKRLRSMQHTRNVKKSIERSAKNIE